VSAVTESAQGELVAAWGRFSQAASPEEFCQTWLALQCHAIGDVREAVVVLQKPGSENFAPLAFWPEGRRERSRLGEVTERALREGRGIVQAEAAPQGTTLAHRPGYHIAYPVRVDGAVRGVVGLAAGWREERELQAAMRQLQWGAGWLEVLLRRVADPMEAARARVRLLLQFLSSLLEREAFEDAAAALVTEISTQLGCDRVSLGVGEGARLRLAAVSHTVQFDRRANLLNATLAAMTEALDQREPIVHPPDRDGRLAVTFAHAELTQLSGAGGVVTLPLANKGRQVGALTLERAPGLRFDAPTVELLESVASLLGPLVDLHLARGRSLPAHAAEAAAGAWSRLVGPRHAAYKAAVLGSVALAAFLFFARGEYRLNADARVEGVVQRAVTAPFASYVREARYRAGDTVKKGEVLARLEDRDLRLERVKLSAQREQLGNQYREAMAKTDRTQVRVVSAQIEQAQAQLALVEEQLARTEVTAPFDGVLISGDLTQALGAPLERGQVLFEVAPLDGYRLVLQVDERAIADVRLGQKGELVLSSMPGASHPLAVAKITPVSTAKDGRNFFRVEAELDSQSGQHLRPGMEGVAKIHVDERRLVSIWTRELVDWLRLKAWTWLP